MDFCQLSVIGSAITAAKQIGQAALGVRDFNLVAEKIAAINEQLLKAQDALLSHNAAMFQLQKENFEAREELRKLEEAMAQRGRYTLVKLAERSFVYRVNVDPELGGASNPGSAQPLHYVCQPCLDIGRKVVLQMTTTMGANALHCPVCKTIFV